MADKIKLTPEVLASQASEMMNLSGMYESLFSGVDKVLNEVNGQWSENLANNFISKITSAKNSFSKVTEMLTSGSEVARRAAETFESVDSLLSGLMNGAGVAAGSILGGITGGEGMINTKLGGAFKQFFSDFWDGAKQQIRDLPEDWKMTGEFLKWLEEKYGEVPEAIREGLESTIPKNWLVSWDATREIIEGEFTWENLYPIISYVTSGTIEGTAAIEIIDYFVQDGYENFHEADAAYTQMEEDMYSEFSEGDILTGFQVGLEGFTDIVIGSSIDILGNIAGSVVDHTLGNIPVIGNITSDIGGHSAGEWIGIGADYVSDGLDIVTDCITAGVDYVSDAFIDSVSTIGSWIGSWF